MYLICVPVGTWDNIFLFHCSGRDKLTKNLTGFAHKNGPRCSEQELFKWHTRLSLHTSAHRFSEVRGSCLSHVLALTDPARQSYWGGMCWAGEGKNWGFQTLVLLYLLITQRISGWQTAITSTISDYATTVNYHFFLIHRPLIRHICIPLLCLCIEAKVGVLLGLSMCKKVQIQYLVVVMWVLSIDCTSIFCPEGNLSSWRENLLVGE